MADTEGVPLSANSRLEAERQRAIASIERLQLHCPYDDTVLKFIAYGPSQPLVGCEKGEFFWLNRSSPVDPRLLKVSSHKADEWKIKYQRRLSTPPHGNTPDSDR